MLMLTFCMLYIPLRPESLSYLCGAAVMRSPSTGFRGNCAAMWFRLRAQPIETRGSYFSVTFGGSRMSPRVSGEGEGRGGGVDAHHAPW